MRERANIWEERMANKKVAQENGQLISLCEVQQATILNLATALDRAASTIEKLLHTIDEATEPDEDEPEKEDAS